MSFADNLRRLRLERFLSQAELARRAGMHAITITRLEAGDQAPTTRTVRALAEALEVQPRDLASPDEVAAARMLGRRGRRATPGGVSDASSQASTVREADRELLDALADAVERLLLAHAADARDSGRDPDAVVRRQSQRLGPEQGTRLLDRIQAPRRARPAGV